MKKMSFSPVVLLILLLSASQLKAQMAKTVQPNFASIANKIVNQSLQVKPGESVLITGTPAEIPMMEQLFVEVSKAGGQPVVQLSLPNAEKQAIMQTSLAYLKMPNTFSLIQSKAVDCIINTGSSQDPQLFSDVPEERLAIMRSANQPLQEAFNLIRVRMVSIGQTGGIPSQQYAKFKNANYEDLQNMFWKAIDVDYDKMRMDGEQISKQFTENAEVMVKTDAGTNLKFKLSKLPARINSGLSYANNPGFTGPSAAWLPAGEVYACIDPQSANGTLVVPETDLRGKWIKNLRLQFANGKITDIKADSNVDLIKSNLDASTGDKDVLSLFDIGINNNSQTLQNSSYYSWEMGGMVTLGVGDNSWAGGSTRASTGFSFHIPNASVTVNGKALTDKGKLITK